MSSEKKLLIPVFLTVFIDLLGATIVLPILAPLFLDLKNGISPIGPDQLTHIPDIIRQRNLIFGLLIASFPLAQFFGAPLLGAWADKIGRKRVLSISLFGTLIGYILFAYGVHQHWVWLLFAARILDGFTGGNISIAFSAISDVSTPETKTRNFGLIGMAFGLGFIIGPWLGGKLSDPAVISWFNFETPFWFAAILCFINLILVRLFFFETLKTASNRPMNLFQGFHNIGKALQRSHLRTIFLVVFLVTFGFSIFTQFLQVYLIQKFSFTQGQIGDYFAFVGLCIAITQGFITRAISKRFAPRTAVLFSMFALSIALILLLIPGQSGYFYLLTPLVAVNQGIMSPNLQTLVSNAGQENEQGEILGINQSVQSLAQGIPPIVAGIVVSLNMYLPILLASVFTFAAWIVFLIYRKKFNPLNHG
ncbi:MAG: MFS transporter [Chitinophagaceae bacterium]|nr:MFS transporter [Chitinophagaceae bacterium]